MRTTAAPGCVHHMEVPELSLNASICFIKMGRLLCFRQFCFYRLINGYNLSSYLITCFSNRSLTDRMAILVFKYLGCTLQRNIMLLVKYTICALIRSPYCIGRFTPHGNSPRIVWWQVGQSLISARCSVTSIFMGGIS